MKISKITSLTLILFFLTLSCSKDDSYIPYARVNLTLSLDDPQYAALRSPGGYVIILNQGVSGIIICRSPWDNQYMMAYDLCSPVNPERKCALVPDTFGTTVMDPCSGKKFYLSDGTLAWNSGYYNNYNNQYQTGLSLKRYNVSRDFYNRLHITN